MHIELTFYTGFVAESGFRCQVSGKVGTIVYSQSALGGTPETSIGGGFRSDALNIDQTINICPADNLTALPGTS